ncbi:MAG: hypothetical protein IJV00_01650 [Clostridia bacterium]|nr:hypothetical protein [Clostridia bacterium]
MNLSLTKKTTGGRISLPTKRSINLALSGQKKTNFALAIPLAILVIVAAVLFSKFAVIDRLNAMYEAESEAARSRRLLDKGYEQIDSYGELTETYAHYTYNGMTDAEKKRINRVEVINMVERVVYQKADVDGFNINGNKLVLKIRDKDLRGANAIVQELRKEEMVEFCAVTEVKTWDHLSSLIYFDEDEEFIVASITVLLNGSLEVDYDQ